MSDKFEAQTVRAPSEIVVVDQSFAVNEDMPPSRVGAQALLGTGAPHHFEAANDDIQGSVAIKRAYKRRKPRDADLRCKTMLSSIHPTDYDQGRTAFNRSWDIGLGLDTAVTLRPEAFQTMGPEERDQEIRLFMKRIRSFYADNDDMPSLAYLLTREASFGENAKTSEHLHLLIHTKTAKSKRKLRRYLHRRYSRIEAKVKTASPDRVMLPSGQIGDASTYSLKAVSEPYAKEYDLPHRFSGPVYGARVFWSENINPVRPRIRVPNPKHKARPNHSQNIKQAAV